MKVGVPIEPRLPGAAEFAVEAERPGVDSPRLAEVCGHDALTGPAAKTGTTGLGTFVARPGSTPMDEPAHVPVHVTAMGTAPPSAQRRIVPAACATPVSVLMQFVGVRNPVGPVVTGRSTGRW